MCQRQLPALALISTAAFQVLIEVVIGSPLPRPQAPSGAIPSVRAARLPILSYLPVFACPVPPSVATDRMGEGLGLSDLCLGGGKKDFKPPCQGLHEQSPPPHKAYLVPRYYE